jgi:hypothetical protein
MFTQYTIHFTGTMILMLASSLILFYTFFFAYTTEQPHQKCSTKAELMFDLLHLNSNSGSLPTEFVQDVDE